MLTNHAHPPKSKPDSEPERHINYDIVKDDSSEAGDKYTTIASGGTPDFDVIAWKLTNGKVDTTIIWRNNPNHNQTTIYNGREYLRAEIVREKPHASIDLVDWNTW